MRTLWIFGAGASYGHGAIGALRPPLAGGFFLPEVRRVLSRDYSGLNAYLSTYCRLTSQMLETLSIETVVEIVDWTWFSKRHDYLDGRERKSLFGREFLFHSARWWIRCYIRDIISTMTEWTFKTPCPYHLLLARFVIRPTDTVMTLNYYSI